jgi:hypothetical protein
MARTLDQIMNDLTRILPASYDMGQTSNMYQIMRAIALEIQVLEEKIDNLADNAVSVDSDGMFKVGVDTIIDIQSAANRVKSVSEEAKEPNKMERLQAPWRIEDE